MKKCPNGHEVNDNLKFCPKCGAELKENGIKFCKKCGTERKGTEIFCSKCGTPFDGFSMTQPTSQPTPSYDDAETSTDYKKIIIPIVIGLIVLALIGGGWWSWKTSIEETVIDTDSLIMTNMDEVKEDVEEKNIELELIKDAYKSVLEKCSSDVEWGELGKYFLYDITGDNIPELWVYADDGSDSNFHIYTFMNKQAISIYNDSFEPSRTSFGYGKSKIYVRTGGMGHEEWSLFKYENGKIENKEVYSWSQNPANYEEEEESGVKPECEEIKTFSINDMKPLMK